MKTYQMFAEKILQLLGDATALRITSDGYMPISIEDIGQTTEGQRLIAMSHTAEQNGDQMRDPEVVFLIHDGKDFLAAEPISFRNDFTDTRSEVYCYDDQGSRLRILEIHCAALGDFKERGRDGPLVDLQPQLERLLRRQFRAHAALLLSGNRVMVFRLLAPECLTPEGVVAKDLTALLDHPVDVIFDDAVETSRRKALHLDVEMMRSLLPCLIGISSTMPFETRFDPPYPR